MLNERDNKDLMFFQNSGVPGESLHAQSYLRGAMIAVLMQADVTRHYARMSSTDNFAVTGEICAGHFEDIAVRCFPDLRSLSDQLAAKREADKRERDQERRLARENLELLRSLEQELQQHAERMPDGFDTRLLDALTNATSQQRGRK